jgi:hypothetical protein
MYGPHSLRYFFCAALDDGVSASKRRLRCLVFSFDRSHGWPLEGSKWKKRTETNEAASAQVEV